MTIEYSVPEYSIVNSIGSGRYKQTNFKDKDG